MNEDKSSFEEVVIEMAQPKSWIFFDCMETLVDMTEVPGLYEYALWTYAGVPEAEALWPDADHFYTDYLLLRSLGREGGEDVGREYSIRERYRTFVRSKLREHTGKTGPTREEEVLLDKLIANFWDNYRRRCVASDGIQRTLEELAPRYRFGVVSNFFIPGGVDKLLEHVGLASYFEEVVASADVGWRKPHEEIYRIMLRRAGVDPLREEAYFIGDNWENDYVAPRALGLRPILYDPKGRRPELRDRCGAFEELPAVLKRVRISGRE